MGGAVVLEIVDEQEAPPSICAHGKAQGVRVVRVYLGGPLRQDCGQATEHPGEGAHKVVQELCAPVRLAHLAEFA